MQEKGLQNEVIEKILKKIYIFPDILCMKKVLNDLLVSSLGRIEIYEWETFEHK